MCLFPKRIQNRKYLPNVKNEGIIPDPPLLGYDSNGLPIYDTRVLTVEIPCGRCIECCRAKAREWQARLSEEIKDWKYMYFVTFTFSPAGLREILFKHGIEENNAAAAFALRHSLELYRKYNKKSYRHWFVTELGHEGTERIHMHGIIFFNEPQEFCKIEQKKDGWMCSWKYWRYGHIFVGDYVNQQSVNYMVKYMNKIDVAHKSFVGQVLCSPGIGRKWIDRMIASGHINLYTYRPRTTLDYYRLNNGSKIKLPKYYSNHILTDEQKELKWRDFMDSGVISIAGNTYYSDEVSNSSLANIENKAQEINYELNYGDSSKSWRKQKHNITRRMLQDQTRRANLEKMLESVRANNYELYLKLIKMQKI